MRKYACTLAIFACLVSFTTDAKYHNMIKVPSGKYKTHDGKIVDVASFYIDKYEFTIGEFKRFVDATQYITTAEKEGGSTIMGGDYVKGVNWRCDAKGEKITVDYNDKPVLYLSYSDVKAYCDWSGKRFLSEIEWDYAFREAKDSKFKYSGSNRGQNVAVNDNFDDNVQGPKNVGTKQPNALGIYDMSGNVNEICMVDSKTLVLKGGGVIDPISVLSYVMRRVAALNETHNWYIGYRLACGVEELKVKN